MPLARRVLWTPHFEVRGRAGPPCRRTSVLGLKEEGDSVNIEIDPHTQAIVDTVERVLPQLLGK